jgi:hypothetical protein
MTDHPTGRRRVGSAVALVAAGLIGGLGATAGAAAFNDVPTESQFAESITNVQEAGIASGFPDGTFRPTSPINRQQAAAWINRAASRSALDFSDQAGEHAPVNPNDPIRQVAEIEMTSPAVGDGGGWVSLDGTVAAATVAEDGTGCPCAFDLTVLNSQDEVVAVGVMTARGPESDDERTGLGPAEVVPVQGVVWLPAGETETYRLVVELKDSDVGNVLVAGILSGSYAPMAEGDPALISDVGSGDAVVSLLPG